MTGNVHVDAILTNVAMQLNLPVYDGKCDFARLDKVRKSQILHLLSRFHTADASRTGAIAQAVLFLLAAGFSAPRFLLRDSITALDLIYSRTLSEIETGSASQQELLQIRRDQEQLATAAQNGGAL